MPQNTHGPVVVGLPVEDRPTASAFYREFLGQVPPGEPQDDGEPEPLQFDVNEGLRLMLVPRGGFGWVIGDDHQVAERGTVEVVLTREVDSESRVDDLAEVAVTAGGAVVVAPGRKPWGHVAVADPDGHLWQIISGAFG
jgi:predicted lactoylglutathione lyase